jgi:hypothetical protein
MTLIFIFKMFKKLNHKHIIRGTQSPHYEGQVLKFEQYIKKLFTEDGKKVIFKEQK